MTSTLGQMICTMRESLQDLKAQRMNYPNSMALENFIKQKTNDFEDFVYLVSGLRLDTFAPNVVEYIRDKKVHYKFFGMTQRPVEYFKMTKKLLKQIEAEKKNN